MSNLTVYRKGFVLSLATVLLAFGMQGIGYSQADSTIDSELSVNRLYDEVIPSVVWITANGNQGSGVLIDREMRIVVTNDHVTENNETIWCAFPIRDRKGDRIKDRKFYRDNLKTLTHLGYISLGRVIAKNSEQDLALVQLSGLPETAHEIKHNFRYPAHRGLKRMDRIHIFGNPTDLKLLWRWTLGAFQGVDERRGMLHISADTYAGNSGGPVVNDDGTLIGLATLSNKNTGTWAIPSDKIKDLLNSVEPRHVFSIQNNTGLIVPYYTKWKENDAWQKTVIKSGKAWNHWYTGSLEDIPDGYPKIRFDYIVDDKQFTPKINKLNTYLRYLGEGVKPDRERDAREYHFGYNSRTQILDLYDSKKK